MKSKILLILIIGQSFLSANCQNTSKSNNQQEISSEFMPYWYAGEAEISSYELQQARYGEIHEGEAVLVFVTEDFSRSKQVKLDNPSRSPSDAVSVLKLNMTKKFFTGIYPYSIMMSSFKPVQINNYPHTFKVTTSSQEWCGHTFFQLNKAKKGYDALLRSYFESEGDRSFTIPENAWLEDELWQMIRINPSTLPTGEITLIPSTIHARLRHTDFSAKKAKARLIPDPEGKDRMIYEVDYENFDRNLKIFFENEFPYLIEGWEETIRSGFGSQAKSLTTKATLKKRIKLDYWNRHDNEDTHYRKKLDLRIN